MGKYGDVSLRTVGLIHQQSNLTPIEAWEQAVSEIFPQSESSRKKGCPKDAFLGLCQEGKVKNIPSSRYTNSKKNKDYALKALSFLNNNPSLAQDPDLLWHEVQNCVDKQHNQQMDVVIALFEARLTT